MASPRCLFAGVPALPRPCGGRITRHHFLAQQRIKREFPYGAWKGWLLPGGRLVPRRRDEPCPPASIVGAVELVTVAALLADVRNIGLICWDHHQLVENRRIYLAVPPAALEYAGELGLEWMLEQDQERRTA